jgi:hypothetical protein
MCDYAIRRRNRSPNTNITPDKQLEYPRHPFPPALSRVISSLPDGFCEMALKTLLSYQVIQLLRRMAQTVEKSPAAFPEDTSIAVEMMRLSMESNATALERAIVTLSFVFGRVLYDASKTSNRVNSSARTYRSMREPLSALARSVFGLAEKAGEEFVVWAVFLLASAKEDYGLERSLQDDTLARLRRAVPVAKKLDSFKEMTKRYFWHTNLESQAEQLWKRMNEPKASD